MLNQQGSDKHDDACDAALGWIARLRSDESSLEDQQSFALWMAESSDNTHAMDQVLELWDDLGVLQKLPSETELPRKAANNSRWIAASVTAAACLVLAIFLWPQLGSDPAVIQYQTAMGEQRSIELPDQSRVQLNTNSSISVSYREDQRHITLVRGEAWFQVAPNKQRPFHVDAGETRVTAIGTAFNVYRDGTTTDITVTEGVVRVTELGETGNRTPSVEVLREQERLVAADDGWKLELSEDIAVQLAWQRGELVAKEMPLPELLEELQRYNSTRILIADPDLAVLTVSGVFQLDEPEATLHALAVSLELQTRALNDTTIQLLKADQ